MNIKQLIINYLAGYDVDREMKRLAKTIASKDKEIGDTVESKEKAIRDIIASKDNIIHELTQKVARISYENEEHIKGYTEQGYRYIPLVPKAIEILEKVKKLNPSGEYIFMDNDRQLSTDSFNRKLKKICKELGLPSYSSHKIRFSSASILYTNGLPLTELQALLGHTTTAMTLHYIRSVTPKETTSEIMCNALN